MCTHVTGALHTQCKNAAEGQLAPSTGTGRGNALVPVGEMHTKVIFFIRLILCIPFTRKSSVNICVMGLLEVGAMRSHNNAVLAGAQSVSATMLRA